VSDTNTKSGPNLFERAIAAVAPGIALNRAIAREKLYFFGYDAANHGAKRGSSGGLSKNASSESPRMARERTELMWDVRDLERNMPIIRCVLDRMMQYVCGRIVFQSRTGDPEIDEIYEEYWEDWCANYSDITGRHDFQTLVGLAFRSMLRDGDFGFVRVRNGDVLSLQSIEADRIGDPYKIGANLDEKYICGITINDLGQPVSYDVFNRTRNNTYKFERQVAAGDFIHLTNPIRTDEYRTATWLCSVLPQARDLYEMFAFERGAAKWAASHAGVIRTQQTGPANRYNSANQWDGKTTTPDGKPAVQVEGNKLIRLADGEDVTVFNTGNRPSGAFVNYIDTSLRDIAMGLNVPYGFFDMTGFGGATVRLETQQLLRTFQRFQGSLVAKLLRPVRRSVFADGIARGKIPPHKNWRWDRWSFGRYITADVGYQTDADITLLNNGLKSASGIVAENSDQGEDYDDIVEQLAKEAKITQEAAIKYDVPVELITGTRFPQATEMLSSLAASKEPPPPPDASTLDGKTLTDLTGLLAKAASGEMPRANVVATLVEVFRLDPAQAEKITPDPVPVAMMAAAGTGKGAQAANAAKEKKIKTVREFAARIRRKLAYD
jgi:lambda family phage portal protein